MGKNGRMRPQVGRKQMLQQIGQLQSKVLEMQEALGEERVTVTAGGGAITVVMTGHQRVESLAIAPDVVDPEDVEMLQDLIIAAVNEAIDRSKALAADRMSALTGGLVIPGFALRLSPKG